MFLLTKEQDTLLHCPYPKSSMTKLQGDRPVIVRNNYGSGGEILATNQQLRFLVIIVFVGHTNCHHTLVDSGSHSTNQIIIVVCSHYMKFYKFINK